ncbi:basic form of pathogenesis-related protein 1-like, partial [Chenopodium quinoa]|uniref:basic form of pathogenesis-related protein 1-like n=1 Tax=Chenopodium quinoa TaxID=63459 RepID=UPI000B76BA12
PKKKNSLKNLATFTCFVIAILAFAQLCNAQNSPQDYVDAHNAARAAVGVGNIQWTDDQVAAYAQQYANQRINDCALQHSQGQYGENLAGGSGELSGTDAVQMWVNEKANYDYNSNSCVGGDCLHYTQVVWRNSVRLGCARVQCNNGGYFIGCNYDPPGNYQGGRPY